MASLPAFGPLGRLLNPGAVWFGDPDPMAYEQTYQPRDHRSRRYLHLRRRRRSWSRETWPPIRSDTIGAVRRLTEEMDFQVSRRLEALDHHHRARPSAPPQHPARAARCRTSER